MHVPKLVSMPANAASSQQFVSLEYKLSPQPASTKIYSQRNAWAKNSKEFTNEYALIACFFQSYLVHLSIFKIEGNGLTIIGMYTELE